MLVLSRILSEGLILQKKGKGKKDFCLVFIVPFIALM